MSVDRGFLGRDMNGRELVPGAYRSMENLAYNGNDSSSNSGSYQNSSTAANYGHGMQQQQQPHTKRSTGIELVRLLRVRNTSEYVMKLWP